MVDGTSDKEADDNETRLTKLYNKAIETVQLADETLLTIDRPVQQRLHVSLIKSLICFIFVMCKHKLIKCNLETKVAPFYYTGLCSSPKLLRRTTATTTTKINNMRMDIKISIFRLRINIVLTGHNSSLVRCVKYT